MACTIVIFVRGSFLLKKKMLLRASTWAKDRSTPAIAPTATKMNRGLPSMKSETSFGKCSIAKSGFKSLLFARSRTPSSFKASLEPSSSQQFPWESSVRFRKEITTEKPASVGA